MVRKIFTPDKQDICFALPKDFVGKKVEIIAFTVDDAPEVTDVPITHFVSESILSKDWLSPEEDEIAFGKTN